MANHRSIMKLVLEDRSYDQIVSVVGCSRRDVSVVKKAVAARGITAEQVEAFTDAEVAELFPDGRRNVSGAYDQPDFTRTLKSMKSNRHFTLQQAWRLYIGAASGQGRKYGYSRFCQLFTEFAAAHDVVATLHHEPGRSMLVDWAGDTLPVADSFTGELRKAYLFVAVLPFSGLVFCQAFGDMKQDAWIGAHVMAFEFYGGATQIVVPDNPTTATHRTVKGDSARVVNARYQEWAEHYGTAIVPARVRRPRDKAAAESAVQTVNKRVIGYLAEETWTTLAELNAAIDERVQEINHQMRRADGSTRFERFDAEEAQALQPLPAERFDTVDWKQLKVGRNYHVTADYQHYSVPYKLAGQVLRVRLTGTRVTIFEGESVVCEHPRKVGRKGQYSTVPGHAPKQHQDVAGLWSRDWFLNRARSFGPATTAVIEMVLNRPQIEAQAYLPCQNILNGLGSKNTQRLEAACQELLNVNGVPTYSTLKRIMATITGDKQRSQPMIPAASNTKSTPADQELPGALVRGAGYYQDRG
jgi:transposase